MIITRTPLRISLIGGGTDIPSFYEKHLGAVVNFAIKKYVYVSCNKRFEDGFRISYSKTEDVESRNQIQHDLVRTALGMTKIFNHLEITSVADIPGHGSGLGSSSSFTVGLLKALLKDPEDLDPRAILAERAWTVETECGASVGKQDQYAAAYGGVNYITFGKRNVCIRRLNVSQEWVDDFERHALLLWTGSGRSANEILKEQSLNAHEGRSVSSMKKMTELAQEFHQAMVSGASIKYLAAIMDEGWRLKRTFASGITNPNVDKWHKDILRCGGWGAKLLGAGGGGFMFVLAPVSTHRDILRETGLRKVDFGIEMEGSKIIYGN